LLELRPVIRPATIGTRMLCRRPQGCHHPAAPRREGQAGSSSRTSL